MYSVFLVNFGFTKSVHKTLEEAVKAAKKTGFQCSIFKEGDPSFTVLKWVSPVGGR
tara:strand:- start:101 stop:268 length:168 start_codon:yes stop_codon:yes gene_type:complete